ncbi:MAG: hypothetical protein RLP12_08355 [Ekhidna sp.]
MAMLIGLGWLAACDKKKEEVVVLTKTELLSRAWEGQSAEFDITFYKNGTHQFFDKDGTMDIEGNWSWTDSNETSINWQVDDDGMPEDYEVAMVTVTKSSLTLTTSEDTYSFTAK